MTDVFCGAVACKNNKNGKCTRIDVTLYTSGSCLECEDFEF